MSLPVASAGASARAAKAASKPPGPISPAIKADHPRAGPVRLSPLPSVELLEAAGLMAAPLLPVTSAFFAGRLISYSLLHRRGQHRRTPPRLSVHLLAHRTVRNRRPDPAPAGCRIPRASTGQDPPSPAATPIPRGPPRMATVEAMARRTETARRESGTPACAGLHLTTAPCALQACFTDSAAPVADSVTPVAASVTAPFTASAAPAAVSRTEPAVAPSSSAAAPTSRSPGA